jgi:hypothetical protein
VVQSRDAKNPPDTVKTACIQPDGMYGLLLNSSVQSHHLQDDRNLGTASHAALFPVSSRRGYDESGYRSQVLTQSPMGAEMPFMP